MADVIDRLNAALSGRYRIERELGQGGMATVYLADDLRHERKVALKVLKPELAAVVGAERFVAEIKTTANLQHPHILPLFDSGEADGFLFYVMPYVEGESLRERLDREKQLPIADAVRIATAVAHALDHAHRRGVIHRDIKPANILLQDGEPVVSDFGIALAVSAAGGGRLTETGLSLGTPHYMSPEQATGDLGIGPPTDVYALACVLYEMLVGEPPYTGSTPQAILGKIIQGRAVPATEIRKSTPANVGATIARALEKLPADRFSSGQDFEHALADPGFRHGEATPEAIAEPVQTWKRVSGVLALTSAALLAMLLLNLRGGGEAAAPPGARFVLNPVEGGGLLTTPSGLDVDISSDGSQIVYVGAAPGGGRVIWRRALDDLAPSMIEGTDGGLSPVISPDGASVAFNRGGAIWVVPLNGGPARRVASTLGVDLSWSTDGWLYFSLGSGIGRVAATGGEPEAFAEPTTGVLRTPMPLPDSRGLLVSVSTGGRETTRIAVVGPAGGEPREIRSGTMARYAPSGHILYTTANGTLMGAPFDLGRLEVTGPSVAMVEGVQVGVSGTGQFTVSNTGTLLYIAGQGATAELTWVGRDGLAQPVDPEWTGDFRFPAVSPDGRRAVLSIEGIDLWTKQLDRGPSVRLTFEGTQNDYPSWSSDGSTVLFFSSRLGAFDVWRKRADGSGEAELVFQGLDLSIAEARWAPGGEWVLLRTNSLQEGAGDIYAIRPGVDSVPTPLLATPFAELTPVVSPDGDWLAYVSDETGDARVYAAPFPNVGDAKIAVSSGTGTEPMWARSGRELFYRDAQGRMVAVPIVRESALSVGAPTILFDAAPFRQDRLRQYYDVGPDDRRFLMVRDVGGDRSLVWIQGFFDELRERTPR